MAEDPTCDRGDQQNRGVRHPSEHGQKCSGCDPPQCVAASCHAGEGHRQYSQDRRLKSVQSGHDPGIRSTSHGQPTQGPQQQRPRKNESQCRGDSSPYAMQQPPCVNGQLCGFGPGKRHAEAQCVAESFTLDPAAFVDQFLLHPRDLRGRSSEACAAQAEPELRHRPKFRSRPTHRSDLEGPCRGNSAPARSRPWPVRETPAATRSCGPD